MTENVKKDPNFAENFVRSKLIQVAKDCAQVGIRSDEFEALVIALTDELDFKDIIKD